MSFQRYAVYYTAPGDLGAAGAAWLGWDIATGQAAAQPEMTDLDLRALTCCPRRYGFHATLKPPFALAKGQTEQALLAAAQGLARSLSAAQSGGLEITRLGRWLALTLRGAPEGVNRIAAQVVETLDPFRAPLTDEAIAQRRARGLSSAQERNLLRWGYPHVMDTYRFHMTLSAPSAQVESLLPLAQAHFATLCADRFMLDAITVAGEDNAGFFHQIARLPLTG